MAKRETSKTKAKAARVNSRKPKAEPFPEARPMEEDENQAWPFPESRPMQEDEIEDLLGALLVRALGVSRFAECPEGIGVPLARQGLERICFTIVDEAMRWAREDGGSKRSVWAGRFLASLSIRLEKRAAWIAEKSKAFERRKRTLSFKFDLEAKPGGSSPYMPHLLRIYDRVVIARDIALDRETWGKRVSEKFPFLFPLSDFESGIPALLVKANEESDTASRERMIFEKIIWPMLKADKGRIEEDKAVRNEMRERMTPTQCNPSFANLKKGFREAWHTLYKRPEGTLRGSERAPL